MNAREIKQKKREHNRIKRRLALGVERTTDQDRLRALKLELGYIKE